MMLMYVEDRLQRNRPDAVNGYMRGMRQVS